MVIGVLAVITQRRRRTSVATIIMRRNTLWEEAVVRAVMLTTRKPISYNTTRKAAILVAFTLYVGVKKMK